jgi:hypothetical protein
MGAPSASGKKIYTRGVGEKSVAAWLRRHDAALSEWQASMREVRAEHDLWFAGARRLREFITEMDRPAMFIRRFHHADEWWAAHPGGDVFDEVASWELSEFRLTERNLPSDESMRLKQQVLSSSECSWVLSQFSWLKLGWIPTYSSELRLWMEQGNNLQRWIRSKQQDPELDWSRDRLRPALDTWHLVFDGRDRLHSPAYRRSHRWPDPVHDVPWTYATELGMTKEDSLVWANFGLKKDLVAKLWIADPSAARAEYGGGVTWDEEDERPNLKGSGGG